LKPEDIELFLKETAYLDFNHPSYDFFANQIAAYKSKKAIAIQLYELVRDHFLYDPYHLDLRPEALKGSVILSKRRAWCVEKAVVLAALARKFEIPSALGYAIVVNHIGVERLQKYLQREEIVFHGYVSLFIEDKWVKCTPAFDRRICKINHVPPLVWDGQTDSMFQSFVGENQFMEYMHEYGEFADVPIQLMNDEMQKYYPHLFESSYNSKEFSFFHL